MNADKHESQLPDEFADLVQTLEAPEVRPFAPAMAADKKAQLRSQLLAPNEQGVLSWREAGNLWRFAGTTVFVVITIVIGAYFWGVLSNPGPIAAPQPTATIEATTTPTVTAVPLTAEALIPEGAQFGNDLILSDVTITALPEGLNVVLDWHVVSQPEEDYMLFFHLLDNQGFLVAQLDQMLITLADPAQPSDLTSTWLAGEKIRKIYLLSIPEGTAMESGQYDLVMGLYDLRTNERLPVTAVNDSFETTDDSTAVHLSTWEFGSGSLEAEQNDNGNHVRLIMFTQKQRPSPTSPIEFEVTLGYDLVSEEEVFLKLAYAHPDWETLAGNGRVPVDDTGDLVILDPKQQTITLTFTGNPAEIEQITGTSNPVFMAQLGYLVEDEAERGWEIVFLTTETFDSFSIELASEYEITSAVEIQYLRVVNTEGLGLTVRAEPGGLPLTIVPEGEVLPVLDGPLDLDGEFWWQVQLSDGTKGWISNDYVEPAAAPE